MVVVREEGMWKTAAVGSYTLNPIHHLKQTNKELNQPTILTSKQTNKQTDKQTKRTRADAHGPEELVDVVARVAGEPAEDDLHTYIYV